MKTILAHLGIENIDVLVRLYQAALHIVIILLLAWGLLHYTGKGIRLLKSYLLVRAGGDGEESKRIDTLARASRYLASVVIILVAGMLVLSELGIAIAPILATAGVLGIAVGFGAQSLVRDYFAGLFLLLEDQVRQGDVVEVAGKSGLVEEVTLRYIKLRDYDGNVHFIPGGSVTTVTNKSRGFAYSVIDVPVAYREDVDAAMALMGEVGAGLQADAGYADRILEAMEMAGVERWAESAVVLRCRFKVRPLEQWNVRREYLRRLKQAFDRRGIEIPYPHLTVYPGRPPAAPSGAPSRTGYRCPPG
jgi:small conductance mechanosensitive channel